MSNPDKEIKQRIEQLASTTGSFPVAAYLLVFDALNKCLLAHKKTRLEPIGALELSQTMAEIVRDGFGPFASHLLLKWDIHSTDDFGKIVYELVDANLLALNEGDTIEDFNNLFPLHDFLNKPFTAEPPYPDIQPVAR
ncbi:MAG: hypothetical protein IKP00_02160 [Victivallales bacterium]|nr:hypothetical protein [Victivallales bacterium]